MVKRFLAVFALFSLVFSCGACVHAAASNGVPVRMPEKDLTAPGWICIRADDAIGGLYCEGLKATRNQPHEL